MSSVSEYRKKLIEQYSGKSSKKKDDEEEKKSNISNTNTSSTETTKPYKKSAYREELLKKYTTDKIKSTDVDKWFDNVSSVFKDMEADNTQDYSGRIKNLLNSSKDVYNYLQNNKDYLEDFDLWDKAFSQNRSALRNLDKWYYDKNYELNKIDNMSVDEIRAKIEGVKTFGDVIHNARLALEARKKGTPDKELEKDLKYIANQYGVDANSVTNTFLDNVYMTSTLESANPSNANKSSNSIDLSAETPESSIAYYEPDGTAVSWKNLLRIKSTEERMSKMESSPEVKAAYDELVEYRDDIKRLENAQFAISAKAEGIAPDSEYEKDLEYVIEKYGLDPTLDMKQPIYEIYMQLVDGSYSGMEDQKAVLEAAGYDWDEFEAYKKYFEDKEREKELQKSYRRFAEDYPVLSTVFSIASAPGQIWDYAKDLVYMAQNSDAADDSFRGMTNVYDNGTTNFIDTIYSTVANNVEKEVTEATGQKWVGWLASSVYSGGTSALQSAATTAVCVGLFGQGAGSKISLGVQASQAASSSFTSAIKNGSTNGEALATSIASGVAEGLFEKISLDHFLKISKGYDVTTLSGLFKSIAKDSKNLVLQGLVESSEEMFTEMANNLADDIINGDHSGYNAAVAQYKSKGYSEEEAKKMATMDYATNVLSAMVGGFIGGVSSGSVAVGTNAIKGTGAYINYQNETVKPHGSALIKQGSKDSLMEFARETAKTDSKLNKYIDKVTKKASAKNVGTLSLKVEQSLSKQNLSDITKRFEDKGIETKDAQKFAGYVNKLLEGEALTQEDKAELRKLKVGEAQIKSALADIVSDPESPINIREADLMLARLGYKGKVTDELTKSSTAKVTETKDAIESGDIAVSENSKAKILSSDETVTIDKNNAIAKIENVDGDTVVYYNTDKGEVAASDVSYASEGDALLYEAFTDLSPSVASSLIRSYANVENNPVPIDAYVEGMREGILFYGKYGFREVGKDILENSAFAKLPKQYQNIALNIGRENSKNETKTAQDKVNSGSTKTNQNGKGRVYFENGAKAGNSSQKRAVSLAKHIASAIGINIAFYDSIISGTVNSDANGWFDRETDTIHLDLQKSASDKHTIAFTLSHEIVHFIEKWSPEKYKVLAGFLMDQYAKHDVKTEVLLQNKMAALDTTDVDLAYREMVADAMESMLLDSNATVKLMELRQKDAGLFNKLKAHILDLINKIRNEYKSRGYEPTSEEGKAVRAMEDSLSGFHKLFEEALAGATESYQNAETKTDKPSDDRVQKQAKARHTGNKEYFEEDKYFKSMMDNWETLGHGSYVKVGTIGQKHPLFLVGMPEGNLRYDVDKLKKNMADHGDYLNVTLLKSIPNIIGNPIAISEYSQENTVSVFGEIFVNNSPMMVGVTISQDRTGNDISKVRTYNARRDVGTLITDKSVLYLNEDKKRTRRWFQACGIQVPLGETKFGFIRSITQNPNSVKEQFQKKTTSNRELLSNALETTAQNDIEKNKLTEYKEKIDLINAEEQKLHDLRGQIKELSFGKEKKDVAELMELLKLIDQDRRKKTKNSQKARTMKISSLKNFVLKELQYEANKTVNRINIYDRQLLNLESTKALKDVLEREKKRAYDRATLKGKEALAAYKKKSATTVMRTKIKNFKTKLERSLLNPTDRVYVPINLANAMIGVCDLIDTDTPLYKADGTINKAQERRNLTKDRLQALKDEYEALKDNADPTYSGEFDEIIYKYLTKLRNEFGEKSLSDMTYEELSEMYDVLKSIEGTLQDARKLIGRSDAQTIYEAADSIISEQAKITKKRKNGKRNVAQRAKDNVIDLSLSPVRNVERMSGYNQNSELVKLFNDFEKGVRQKNFFVMQAYKAFEELTTGDNSKAYDDAIYKEYGDKKYTDVNGRKFGISKMQMMQTILSYEREVANNMHHIEGNGFAFADMDMLRKGKLKEAVSEEHSHRLPAAIGLVEEFKSALENDKWSQDYMEAARKFFNGTAKDAINETYLTLKHRIIARDKSYIPFEVDRNFVVREISAQNDIQQTINSYGMLQETKKNASQPLIITGLNNILDRHIDQVGNVYGLAVPVRNFNKVWNARSVASDFGDPSVQAAIQRNWGLGGTKHITQTVQDLQASRPNTQSDIYRKIKSGYIGATFLLNLSVVTKQIGSLYAATSMLKWRGGFRMFANLVGTMANSKKISAEVDKYTATAWMRRQGLSDAELYTLTTESKKPGLLKFFSKFPTVINPSKWITAMDHAVALSLWKYAKQDTAKRTGLKGEELLRATAEFYDSVIENTQSMTDVLHRPEIQKKNDVVSEAFGMFKTDLYQMAGQLQVSLGRFNANKNAENGKVLGRTVYAILRSAIWGSLMTTLFALLRYKVNPYRDEDDKDLTIWSWMKRLLFGLGGDVVGYFLPLAGSEIVGVFENIMYGESEDIVDSLALTAINDLYDAMVTAGSAIKDGEMPSAEQYTKLAVKALQVFGVPANNIKRMVDAIKLHAKDIANGQFLSYEAGAERTSANYMYGIIEEVLAGNTEEAEKRFDKAAADKGDAKLKAALGKIYKEGDIDAETTKDILSEYFGLENDEIYWQFDEWDYAIENGDSDDYAKYDDFYSAVESGKNLKAVIKRYVDNGVEKKTLSSQITKYFKPLYIEMSKSERANLKGYLLNAYVQLGYDRKEKSKDIDKWLEN